MHLAQLTIEEPSRNAGRDGGKQCEYGRRYQRDDRYPFAFGAGLLIGLAATAIGVYRVSYRTMTSFVDVFVLFTGGLLVLTSVTCILGYVGLYTVLK